MPTAIQAQLIEGPGMGLVTHLDPRHVPDQAWVNGRNVRFPTGGSRIQKTDGYTRLDNTPGNESIRALWNYVHPNGTQAFVRLTTKRVLTGLGSAIHDITDINVPTATLDDVLTVVGYTDYMIWADGRTTRPMRWNGSGQASTLFPGELPNGKIVEIHKNRLLLANITEDPAAPGPQPWRLMYSKIGNPRDMVDAEGGEAGDIDFIDDNLPITCVKVLGDVAIVHKPSRIYRLVAVGLPNNYQIEGIPSDDGAVCARAAITVGAYQFYMGKSNFYRLSAFPEPIGDAIWPAIATNIDWDLAHRFYVYRRYEFDEICWQTIQKDGKTLAACYNFRDQTWTLVDHNPGTCYGEFQPKIVPSVENPGKIVEVFGQSNGRIQVYDGSLDADGERIHAWVESKHFTNGLIPVKILAVACYATGTAGINVNCRAAMDPRQPMPPWSGPIPTLFLDAVQTRPWVDVREYGRVWQIRIESKISNHTWSVQAYGPAVILGGHAR